MSSQHELTQLLLDWSAGNKDALDRLMPLIYDELHRLAQRYMRRERLDHTLQTSALLNEAYLRLIDQKRVSWQNRAHFFAIAAGMMRRILVDHSRMRAYAKRGGEQQKIDLDDVAVLAKSKAFDVLALDDALKSLQAIDEQQSRIVDLRFFGGLTIEETAEVLGVSHSTVEREWSMARAWLKREMKQQ
jgi:RNA polymerase sigma-70 factor, ECF subfamily